MKKNIYLVFALLSFSPIMATQKVTKSLIVASTLVLSKTNANRTFDKKLSLDLHYAIEKNDYASAKKLIKNPQVDVNAKVDYGIDSLHKGWTPLIKCCDQGDEAFNIATALLEREDIKVNLQKNNGFTPLIQCAWKGDEVFKIATALLIREDINVNLQDNDGYTPLIHCAWKGDEAFKIATALLSRQDTNVNLQNKNGWTPLIECAWKGDEAFKIATALVAHKDININLQDNDGDTPLDNIVYWIKDNKENYTYVKLWNMVVARGGILDKRKNDYNNLNRSDFQEPQKGYVQWIKSTPPINLAPFTKRLEQTIQSKDKAIQNLKNENKQSIEKFNESQKKLTTTKKTVQQQKKKINNHFNTMNNQKQTISNNNKQIKSLTNQLAIAHQLQEQKQKAIQQQKKTIQNNNEQIQDLINGLAANKQNIQQQTQQIETKDKESNRLKEEIQHYLRKIESLKDDANKVKDRFATFKQRIKQKAEKLKYETKNMITRLYRSQKNLEKARDALQNRLSTTMKTVEEQNKEKELLHKEIEKLKRNFGKEFSLDLCDAIYRHNNTLAQELINNPEVDINMQDRNGFTPLLWCCWNGDKALSIAKLVIEHPDIDVTVKDKYGKNALHIVCLKGALNILALLLKQPKVEQLLQEEDRDKKTPLDVLFGQITGEHYNITYLSIWNILVDKGARLKIRQQDYDNLNLNSFQEPQKTCIRLIKQNPPKILKRKKRNILSYLRKMFFSL